MTKNYDNIKVEYAQIGITTRCNSNCYFCFREELERRGASKEKVDMTTQTFKKIINTETLKRVHFCGNRGEAIFHPEFEKFIELAKEKFLNITINTNGDRFDEDWWFNLGKKFNKDDVIIFALDGLIKTHKIYRNTDWKRVFSNMVAFIKGGGNAIWQMILFKHNEKDVNIVKLISKIIGCSEVWIINSRLYNETYEEPLTIHNKTKGQILRHLFENKIQPKILCRFDYGRKVYIGIDGSVWPCCYSRCHLSFLEFYQYSQQSPDIQMIEKMKKCTNVNNYNLNEIVNNSELFKFVFSGLNYPFNFEEPFESPIANKSVNFTIHRIHKLYCNQFIDKISRKEMKV